jgi:hypothetical protein
MSPSVTAGFQPMPNTHDPRDNRAGRPPAARRAVRTRPWCEADRISRGVGDMAELDIGPGTLDAIPPPIPTPLTFTHFRRAARCRSPSRHVPLATSCVCCRRRGSMLDVGGGRGYTVIGAHRHCGSGPHRRQRRPVVVPDRSRRADLLVPAPRPGSVCGEQRWLPSPKPSPRPYAKAPDPAHLPLLMRRRER